MPQPIKLEPCPFCEGPPMPVVRTDELGEIRPELIPEAGLWVEAYVFCHECGAQGPEYEDDVYDADDIERMKGEAVKLWQQRDKRNRDLYDAGDVEGLNLYPRVSDRGPEIDPRHTDHCKSRLLHGDGVCECGIEGRIHHG